MAMFCMALGMAIAWFFTGLSFALGAIFFIAGFYLLFL